MTREKIIHDQSQRKLQLARLGSGSDLLPIALLKGPGNTTVMDDTVNASVIDKCAHMTMSH